MAEEYIANLTGSPQTKMLQVMFFLNFHVHSKKIKGLASTNPRLGMNRRIDQRLRWKMVDLFFYVLPLDLFIVVS